MDRRGRRDGAHALRSRLRVLHAISGTRYRRAVTALTLFGGFASTVFWPLSLWLQEAYGWRAAFGAFAAMHVVVLPAAASRRDSRDPCAPTAGRRKRRRHRRRGLRSMPAGATFVLARARARRAPSFIASALSAHAIGLLTASGLTRGRRGARSARCSVRCRSQAASLEFTVGKNLRAQSRRHARVRGAGGRAAAAVAGARRAC